MVFALGALKNFANVTGKIHEFESLFKKASGPQACKFVKKGLQHRYFSVKLARFSRGLAFSEHLLWLVFNSSKSNNMFRDFSGIPLTQNKSLITCSCYSDKVNLKMHSLTKNLFRQSVSVTDLEQTRRDLI